LIQQFQTLGNPDREKMRSAALDFCADIQARKPARWLTLLGPSGTGKTMLAKLVRRFVREQASFYRIGSGDGSVVQQHANYWASWPEMVEQMKDGDFSTVRMLTEMEDKWNGQRGPTYWFEAIDDIGQLEDQTKTYLIGALCRLADARLGHWTVWTCNLGLSQIAAQLDQRIASRMIRGGNVVVTNKCRDWKMENV
jgi:energy-coupling factor transporter ATP-binding protein EcfA2